MKLTQRNNNDQTTVYVARAAVQLINGDIFSVEPPQRHIEALKEARRQGEYSFVDEYGWILSNDKWANRLDAAIVALQAKQIVQLLSPEVGLLSEDLWPVTD